MSNQSRNDDAPIWGAKAIAEAINRSERQTYWLLQSGQIPAQKVGDRYVTTWRKLRELFEGTAA